MMQAVSPLPLPLLLCSFCFLVLACVPAFFLGPLFPFFPRYLALCFSAVSCLPSAVFPAFPLSSFGVCALADVSCDVPGLPGGLGLTTWSHWC